MTVGSATGASMLLSNRQAGIIAIGTMAIAAMSCENTFEVITTGALVIAGRKIAIAGRIMSKLDYKTHTYVLETFDGIANWLIG